jgi:hypothetical protein
MTTSSAPPKRRFVRWVWIFLTFAILLLIAFLLGFVPERSQAIQLRTDLQTMRQENQHLQVQARLARARDLMNRVYLEVTRNNFGLASQYATQSFDEIRGNLDSVDNPAEKSALQDISSHRDQVIAGLAKPDPNVRMLVANILDQMNKNPAP